MYGTKESPELPQYGNKVIGVRDGRIEFHGKNIGTPWSQLDSSASAGDTSITVQDPNGDIKADWEVTDYELVIAPTSFDAYEAERRTITSITDNSGTVTINFATPLRFQHYAGEESYATASGGTKTLVMRAEVGLLSRNVVYRGDPSDSSRMRYGAHIMMSNEGNSAAIAEGNTIVGKFSNAEFRDVGQAFQLGRYPIHFHLIGNINESYVKNCAIHDTYNRAVRYT